MKRLCLLRLCQKLECKNCPIFLPQHNMFQRFPITSSLASVGALYLSYHVFLSPSNRNNFLRHNATNSPESQSALDQNSDSNTRNISLQEYQIAMLKVQNLIHREKYREAYEYLCGSGMVDNESQASVKDQQEQLDSTVGHRLLENGLNEDEDLQFQLAVLLYHLSHSDPHFSQNSEPSIKDPDMLHKSEELFLKSIQPYSVSKDLMKQCHKRVSTPQWALEDHFDYLPGLYNPITNHVLPQYIPLIQSHLTVKKVEFGHPSFPERGLFATKPIPKGTIIGEYTGEMEFLEDPEQEGSSQDSSDENVEGGILSQMRHFVASSSSERVSKLSKKSDFSWNLSQYNLTVNGTNKGNELRFVNDYRGISNERNVNVIFRAGHMFYYATKDIEEGDELLTDYGVKYWVGRGKYEGFSSFI